MEYMQKNQPRRSTAGLLCAVALLLACGTASAHGMRPFREVDTNRDEVISLDEYAAHSQQRAVLAAANFEEPLAVAHPFTEIDTDKDGAVSRQEYEDYSKKLMTEGNLPVKIGL